MRLIYTLFFSFFILPSAYAYDYILSATSVNIRDSINIKRDPNKKPKIVANLKFGTKLTKLEGVFERSSDKTPKWTKVETPNNKIGWILTKYITYISNDNEEFYLDIVRKRLTTRKNSTKDLNEITNFVHDDLKVSSFDLFPEESIPEKKPKKEIPSQNEGGLLGFFANIGTNTNTKYSEDLNKYTCKISCTTTGSTSAGLGGNSQKISFTVEATSRAEARKYISSRKSKLCRDIGMLPVSMTGASCSY